MRGREGAHDAREDLADGWSNGLRKGRRDGNRDRRGKQRVFDQVLAPFVPYQTVQSTIQSLFHHEPVSIIMMRGTEAGYNPAFLLGASRKTP